MTPPIVYCDWLGLFRWCDTNLGYVGVPSPGVSIRLAEFQPSPLGTKGNYKVVFEIDSDQIGNHDAVKVMRRILLRARLEGKYILFIN